MNLHSASMRRRADAATEIVACSTEELAALNKRGCDICGATIRQLGIRLDH